MIDQFYMQDSRSLLGTNVMFHRKNGCGYGTNLDDLEVYTLEDAQRDHNFRETDIPLLKSLVDELSIMAVDHQVLPKSDTIDPNDQYLIQVGRHWNGNDILFFSDGCNSYNYNKARILTAKEIYECLCLIGSDNLIIFSKKALDAVARRTFQAENINRRKMIFKPGIKLIKPKRPKKPIYHCHGCGRFMSEHQIYAIGCPNCGADNSP